MNVVVKRGNEWLIGKIEVDNTFVSYKSIKKLKDVNDVSSYITLKKYIKNSKLDESLENELKSKNGLDSIYVLSKPAYCPSEDEEKRWWHMLNGKCLNCSKKCKQSSFVEIVQCPDYEGKKL